MLKRIVLFVITNLLVMVTISIILNVLGVGHYITAQGIDYSSLMVFCLVWGMGGAFISLAMSRVMAKWMMGVQVIDPQNPGQFAWLVQMVTELSRSAQLPVVPEIGVYQSAEINAFATGPSKRRALVAFSTGILQQMNREELAGVAAHELAHIKNGDMVTMTLLQGVVNAFVMFLSRIIAFAVSQNVKEENRHMVNFLTVLVLDIALTLLGSIVVCWFSRQREFRADAGAAAIGGRGRMVAALESLKRVYGFDAGDQAATQESFSTMKISGKAGGLMALLSTHPSLDARISRLQNFA
ncbi:MAG: protease HtpX [Proteobacteria bacterium]|nr:protease HtpX [Pseudomonadota bacterium]